MFSKNYRSDKHMFTIAAQAFLVLALWFVVCGFTRMPGVTSICDFY